MAGIEQHYSHCRDEELEILRESDPEAEYCEICEMWLNGPTQWEDHRIGKKHKKNIWRQENGFPANSKCGKKKKSTGKGVEIPKGTAFLIEQSAIYDDAVKTFILSLYKRGLLRARL